MNRLLVLCAALLAASNAYAKPPKKPVEPLPTAPPPAPSEAFETSDVKMGDALDQACLASPLTVETYDARDDLLIVPLTDGGHAFIHFESGCSFNTMMFADEVTPKSADGTCVKKGDAIFFSDGYGGGAACTIAQINRWHPERDALPDTEEMTN